MKKENSMINIYISIVIYILINIFILIMLKNKYSIIVIGSFIFVNSVIFLLLTISLNKKNTYYEIIIGVFYMLFFLIAPLIQLNNGEFPISFPINEKNIILANNINGIFLLAYIIFRFIKNDTREINYTNVISKQSIIVIWVIVIFLTVLFSPMLLKQIFNRNISFSDSQGINLIIIKCIFFFPLILVFYNLSEYYKIRNKKNFKLLILSLLILILFKNPLTDKRNALGPIYLSIFMYIFKNKISPKKFMIAFTIIFIIGFPVIATFTHSKSGLNELLNKNINIFDISIYINQFKEMHFDAFENLNVAIDYVSRNGIMFGNNLISSILFFIPRKIWPYKAITSGKIIGSHLINNYGFHFDNLSCTITAESYLAFGILGVLIVPLILAYVGRIINRYINDSTYTSLIARYCVIHLFFLMRGDLMNGIAYLIGPLISLIIVPKIINKIIKLKFII